MRTPVAFALALTVAAVLSGPAFAHGDHMHAAIGEVLAGANLWTITLQDITRGETFSTTVPYSSTHLTAEWIEETPLLIGTDAGFAALPNLTNPSFAHATTNGAAANL